MSKKFVIKKVWLVGFLLFSALFLLIAKYALSTEAKLSMSAWEDVHEWRTEGECADCHSEHEHVENAVDFNTTLAIPSAESHSEQFLRYTHGKGKNSGSHSCQSCHASSSCQNCHGILPEGHTTDFFEPTGNSIGSKRHALLGKTNVTSCLTCHRSFVEECTQCHTTQEVMPWQEEAEKSLDRWSEILELK